ncbi:MAG: PAQR family membrane homeostasis protein TrhA [Acidimicrobiales bacterium]
MTPTRTKSEDGRADTATAPMAVAAKPLLRGWFHLGALVVFLVAGPLLSAHARTAWTCAALVVYVVSIVALFGVSSAFHRITWSPAARRRMRRADHATIFIGIAGTYTAVAGLVLGGWAQVLVLTLVWVGAAGGIAFRQLWLDAPKWVIALPYVVVGWSALAVMPQLLHGLGGAGFGLLLGGGCLYSGGALVYALRRPDPAPGVFGYHEVFHLCTVLGAALHFAAISAYALPRS